MTALDYASRYYDKKYQKFFFHTVPILIKNAYEEFKLIVSIYGMFYFEIHRWMHSKIPYYQVLSAK